MQNNSNSVLYLLKYGRFSAAKQVLFKGYAEAYDLDDNYMAENYFVRLCECILWERMKLLQEKAGLGNPIEEKEKELELVLSTEISKLIDDATLATESANQKDIDEMLSIEPSARKDEDRREIEETIPTDIQETVENDNYKFVRDRKGLIRDMRKRLRDFYG